MNPRPHPARAARRAVVAAVAALVLLAGCSSTPDDGPTQIADQGYQSGDGSVRTWAVAERGPALDPAMPTRFGTSER